MMMTYQIGISQEQSIFVDKSTSGGFGSVQYLSSKINGSHQDWIGIGGGINIEHFFFGIYGQSTIDDYPWRSVDMANQLTVAHGGFWVGYNFREDDVIHLYSTVRFGGGRATLYNPTSNEQLESIEDGITHLQPELGIEINVASFLRLGASISYSFYDSLAKIPGYTNDSLSGYRPMLVMRIGRFE